MVTTQPPTTVTTRWPARLIITDHKVKPAMARASRETSRTRPLDPGSGLSVYVPNRRVRAE
jgi:hypothetical protein